MSTIKQRIENSLSSAGTRSARSNILSVIFILLSLSVIYFANQFPDEGNLGPGAFPILISIGIIVCAAIDIVTGGETEMEIDEFDFKPPFIVLTVLITYLLLIPIAGFLAGTMLYMPVILYYSDIQSKSLIATLSIGFPIVLFYIFARVFLVRLPEGIIPISRLLPNLPLMVMF